MNKKGFSMIEILVGLAVISIAALAFTPLITKQLKRHAKTSAECKNGIEYRTEIFETPGEHTVHSDKDMINVYTITLVGGGGGGGAGVYATQPNNGTITNVSDTTALNNIFRPRVDVSSTTGKYNKVTTTGYGTFMVGNVTLEMVGAGKVSTEKGSCRDQYRCESSSEQNDPNKCEKVAIRGDKVWCCSGSNRYNNCRSSISSCNSYCSLARNNSKYSCSDYWVSWTNQEIGTSYKGLCSAYNYDNVGPAGCSMTRTLGPEWEFASVSSQGIESTTSASPLTGFTLQSVLGGTRTVKVPTVKSDGTCPAASDGGEIFAGIPTPETQQCRNLSSSEWSSYNCTTKYDYYNTGNIAYNSPYLNIGGGRGADKQGVGAQIGAIKYSYSPNSFAQAGQGGGGGGYVQFSNIIAPRTREVKFTVGKGGAGSTTAVGANGGDTSVYIGGVHYVAYGGMGGHYVIGNKYNWWKSQCSADTRARTDGYCSDKDCCSGDGGAVKALDGLGGDVVVGAYNQSGLGQRGRGSVGAQPYLTNYNKEYSSKTDYDFNIRVQSELQINGGDGGGGIDGVNGGLGGCQGATNATQCIGQEDGGNGRSYSRTTKSGGGEGGGGGSCSTAKCGAGGAGGNGYVIFEYQVKCD